MGTGRLCPFASLPSPSFFPVDLHLQSQGLHNHRTQGTQLQQKMEQLWVAFLKLVQCLVLLPVYNSKDVAKAVAFFPFRRGTIANRGTRMRTLALLLDDKVVEIGEQESLGFFPRSVCRIEAMLVGWVPCGPKGDRGANRSFFALEEVFFLGVGVSERRRRGFFFFLLLLVGLGGGTTRALRWSREDSLVGAMVAEQNRV